MDSQDFSTSIVVDQSPEEVFRAVNDVRGWWTQNIEGRTDQWTVTLRLILEHIGGLSGSLKWFLMKK